MPDSRNGYTVFVASLEAGSEPEAFYVSAIDFPAAEEAAQLLAIAARADLISVKPKT
jgi:hypothetical protein